MPRKAESSSGPTKKSKRAGKLSLHPMEFEDALAVMLNTPPPLKPAKAAAKNTAKKASKR
jgi:homogentisate 1,2-dioxygenase